MNPRSGFTMVEILAVILLIAILAAVAVPKYLTLVKGARNKAGQSGLAEAEATLSTAYAKLLLTLDGTPTASEVADEGFGSGYDENAVDFGDIILSVAITEPDILLTVVSVQGSTDIDTVNTTWSLPSASL